MKATIIKNLLALLLFIAVIVAMACFLPLKATAGIILLMQFFILLVITNRAPHEED